MDTKNTAFNCRSLIIGRSSCLLLGLSLPLYCLYCISNEGLLDFFLTFDKRGEEAGGKEKEKEDMIRKEAGG